MARVLDPEGMFVVECFVPDAAQFDRGHRIQAVAVTEDAAIIEVPPWSGCAAASASRRRRPDGDPRVAP